MGNKQCKSFNGATTLKDIIIWSTIEILNELQDSKGNQKYCAIRSPDNAYYDESNNKDNRESNG